MARIRRTAAAIMAALVMPTATNRTGTVTTVTTGTDSPNRHGLLI
jgi:hypothetical protein